MLIRRAWASVVVGIAASAAIACSDDEQTSGGASGAAAGSGSAGAAPATGGGAGTGGASTGGTATGGDTATGGSVSGSGGAVGGAGSPGTAGEPGSGGAGGAEPRASTCPGASVTPLAQAQVPPGYCAWVWADGLAAPRGMTVSASGDVLVVVRDTNEVILLHDDDGSHVSDPGERVTLASAPGITHGIAMHGGFLYASSGSTVYRWPYQSGDRTPLGAPATVVTDIPTGGHGTRTLAFDDAGNLYVSIGSGSNVDGDSSRSRVVRFTPAQLDGGATFGESELFADGLRNEVGLRFDSRGRLWGVENGLDNLNRADLGGDIHDDNPAEEVNLFAEPGRFYGYPYCWSEFFLPPGVGEGPGAQWAHPDFIDDGTHSDAWCKNPDNVVVPAASMQAHSAPLDILFYSGGSFPDDVVGDALVSFHGSWNRSPATGYKVVRLPYDAAGLPTGEVVPLLEYAGGGDTAGDWPHRPVGLGELGSGLVLVTSDASDVVIAVGHDGS